MIAQPARSRPRFRELGLILCAGLILLWAMLTESAAWLHGVKPDLPLQAALTSQVARDSVAVMAGALVMMLLASAFLAWKLPRADQIMLPMACMLTGLGLVMIRRLAFISTPVPALLGTLGFRQLEGIVAGLVLLLIAALAFRDYAGLKRYKYTLAALGFMLIVGTKFFGVDPYHEGYKRWFGFHGLYYQPVELLKILLVIFFAAYLEEKREVLANAYLRIGRLRIPPLQYVGPLFATWLLALGLLLFQNDLGSALLFFGIFLAMVYVASPRVIYSLIGLVMIAVGAVVAYHFNAHVHDRVVTWINPWPYAKDASYQLVQALIGLASGGLPGAGLGQGSPLLVPIVQSDFIFSAFGEELGLIGTMFILAGYLVITYRGLHIAVMARDTFDKLLAAGLTSAIVIQALVVIGSNVRLLPIVGVTLPFMSYGPSSLLSNFIAVGMLLRISANAAAAPPPVADPAAAGAAVAPTGSQTRRVASKVGVGAP